MRWPNPKLREERPVKETNDGEFSLEGLIEPWKEIR